MCEPSPFGCDSTLRRIPALVGMATDYTNGTHACQHGSKVTWIYVNLRIDAQATSFGIVWPTLQGQTGTGTFELQSIGIDFAQNVVATLEVPGADPAAGDTDRLQPARLPVRDRHAAARAVYGLLRRRRKRRCVDPRAVRLHVGFAVSGTRPGLAHGRRRWQCRATIRRARTIVVNPFIDVGPEPRRRTPASLS